MKNYSRSIHDLIYGRQNNRILRLAYPNKDAPAAEFLVNKIDARESLSKDFEFKVELLSDEPSIALKEMQGKLLSIELVRQDGSLRYFTGHVFSFRRKHSDGGITIYEAVLNSWVKFLSLRKDNYIFHFKSLRDQTEEILRDYGLLTQWDWRVTGEDPVLTDAYQFNESDFNYLSRRWEAAGWYYWFEHDASGHKLIVSNDSIQAPAIDGSVQVRFNGEGGAVEEDAIDYWSPIRQSIQSSLAINSFDFKNPTPINISLPTLTVQGSIPDIESYEYVGAYGFQDTSNGDAKCRIRLEEMEAIAKHIDSQSSNRFLMPGRWFQFINHFNHNNFSRAKNPAKNEFLIISIHHVATNNYLKKEEGTILYRNWFNCTRKDIPWRPGRNFNSNDTRILAPQTAIVVGPPGPDCIYTDEYGRVRVQFHWDREGNNDERSSAWIRVSSSWAGAELGVSTIPRVGSEVIVQWLNGCPDRPIITGAVVNERNMPPWSMPEQRALTGFRSRELAPETGNSPVGRSNHLILDDTNGQIQAQLKSDHLHSQLSLGFITRIENNRGRMDTRGEGWELRTDGYGALRSAKGMLITSEPRDRGNSHISDMTETLHQLEEATQSHQTLSKEAIDQKAQEWGHQDHVVDELQRQNQRISELSEIPNNSTSPDLIISSAAGLSVTTKQSTHLSSIENIAITAKQDVSIATEDSLFASVTQTIRLFAKRAGVKLLAAAGKISIIAKTEDVEITAAKILTLLSENDWIELRGKKGIRLIGAESVVEISDKVQFFTSSPTLFHGNLETLPPSRKKILSSGSSPSAESSKETFDEQFRIVDSDGATPIKDRKYRITADDGQTWEGRSDEDGLTQRVTTQSRVKIFLTLLPD